MHARSYFLFSGDSILTSAQIDIDAVRF